MTFDIRPLRYKDLDRIYPEGEDKEIGEFAFAKGDWPQNMHGGWNWAIDEKTDVFLLRFPMGRDDSSVRYLFGMPGGVVLLNKERYCLFSFSYVSPTLAEHMELVESRIREAFRATGEWIDGITDENDDRAVPNAQFIRNGKKGA